jgi:Protein of unknown function (DUF1573)
MKYLFILVFTAIFSMANAQTPVKFKELKHSFGKILKDKPVTYIFSFKNTGTKPLVIESANAECGCTTPEYPKEPIIKGKDAKIKVTYNAANLGTFTKKVHVKFANIEAPIDLEITGEVITK